MSSFNFRKAAAAGLLMAVSAGAANAYEAGDYVLRFGAASVNPADSSGDIAGFPGNGVSVDDSIGLGISLSYFVDSNVAIEVLGASPFTHDVYATGPDLSGLGKIAEVTHLPPTVLVNYYIDVASMPSFKPYVGIGVNHTFFFDEEASASLEGALGKSDVDLDSSTGLALQLGADHQLGAHWSINWAVWNIDIDTTARINFEADPNDPNDDGSTTVDVDIDPWVYMVGAAYRF